MRGKSRDFLLKNGYYLNIMYVYNHINQDISIQGDGGSVADNMLLPKSP